MTSPLNDVLRRLDHRGLKKAGAGWAAQCPGHDDEHASLTIGKGEDGRVLLHCHAGCNPEDIVSALGMRMGDLFPAAAVDDDGGRRLAATYSYRGEDGAVLYQVVRFEPKAFRQRQPDGRGGWIWNLQGVRRVLYRLPEIRRAPLGEVVFIVEGERDAETLAERGLQATTNPGGAGKWRPEYSDSLRGKDIVILPDNDVAGRNHAREIVRALEGAAARVRVLELPGLPDKGDVSDWLAHGGTVADLAFNLVEDAPAGIEWAARTTESAGALNRDGLREADVIRAPESARGKAESGRARVIRAADVAPEAVTWLWREWIPLGKVTVLDGDPGLGKSTMLVDLAARLTTGRPFPGESTGREPGSVLFVAHEDGIADTLVPRLNAAGADTTRVDVLEGFEEESGSAPRLPSIPADIPAIEQIIVSGGVRLVVVDPLYAYLGGGTDSYRDHDVRKALAPLATMAARTGCAVVLVRHLRKAGGAPALYRGGGSIGIIGIARSGLVLAKDPDDEGARVVACVKSNLGPPPASLGWRFTGGTPPRVEWTGASRHSADSLVNVQPDDGEGRSALDDACDFLRERLAGGEMLVGEVKREARKAGIHDRTLERAKARLGVRHRRLTFGGDYVWFLPDGSMPAAGSATASMAADDPAAADKSSKSPKEPNGLLVRLDHARQDVLAGMTAPAEEEGIL